MTGTDEGVDTLLEGVLAGDHRALARTISRIEDRAPGYRDLVAALYEHAGNAHVVGVTGSPGAGKSTLVDKLAERYRDRGETVGVIAIDPSSPFSGGAVLGDRIRMAATVGDMDVFVRSMSARGSLGGLSTATADAVTAMDAFGKDRIIVETVGAGQNEIDVVRTAETVVVLVPPGSGDAVQTLKAGILEIADCFVVNKADRDGADRTVRELREMIELGDGGHRRDAERSVHHGPSSSDASAATTSPDASAATDPGESQAEGWSPPILETVATTAAGVPALLDALDDHRSYLETSGERERRVRDRHAEMIRRLLREDLHAILAGELESAGGVEDLAAAVGRGETDPYTLASEVLSPVEACLEDLEGLESVDSASR